MRKKLVAWLVAGLFMFGMVGLAEANLIGPLPYLSFNDSPFLGENFSYFHFENFEDGLFNTPGVLAVNNNPGGSVLSAIGPGLYTDSVDGDDGNIDGLGRDGHSFAASSNDGGDHFGHTYTFDAQILGALPTHVGIVWTDGSKTAPTQFEAFDSIGISLGIIGPIHISDNSFSGTTGEDKFFGAINETGISSFVIRDPGGINTLDVDHLQYGLITASVPESAPVNAPVPEPATMLFFGIGIAGLAVNRLRKKK